MIEDSAPGDVLPQPYGDMLRQHFARAADEILRRPPVRDRESWELRRAQVRRDLIEALGGFPERTPLNARVTSVHRRPGYRIENVIFESRPRFYVTASVYVPDGPARPAPAVLCPHGHWRGGRYNPTVQSRCGGLARRGFVALCLDAVGYNEREPMGHFRTWNLEAVGLTMQGVMLWDNVRAIDYLCGREDVDPERIGCTGASGGGNQTMHVSALDERIKAAVPVCSVEMVQDYVTKDLCTCETFAGILRVGDLPEILGLMAPRALLMVNGILDDGFPILEARRAASRLRDIYAWYDPKRFAAFESYSRHDYNAEMRRAMYAWFEQWLMGRSEPPAEEPPEEVVDEELLRALPDGLPTGYRTIGDLFRERADSLPKPAAPPTAEGWQEQRRSLAARLWQVLGGAPERTPLDVRPVGVERRDGLRLERFWFRGEPDVVLPAWLLSPDDGAVHDATLYLLDGGKAALDWEEAVAEARRGRAVLAFDQRGVGETAYDHHLAFIAGLGLGRPPVAMYVWDVVRCLDYLGGRGDIGPVRLVARGSLPVAMTGLLAAALDRRLAAVQLDPLPAGLRHGYEGEGQHFVWPTDELYLPRLLEVADVPEIAALVAPRPLRLRGLLGAALEPLPSAAAAVAFRFATDVYALLGASDHLLLE